MGFYYHDFVRMYNQTEIIRFEELCSLAEFHNFSVTLIEGTKSQYRFFSPDFPTRPFLVDKFRDNPKQQRSIIRACEEIRKLNIEEAEQQIMFEPALKTDLSEFGTIPEDIEVVKGKEHTGLFFRVKDYPQIATKLGEVFGIENLDECFAYLRERANKLKGALDVAEKDHGFTVCRYPNGTLFLSHSVLSSTLQLNAFRPKRENYTSISLVEALVEQATVARSVTQKYLQNIEQSYALKRVNSNGNKSINFECTDIVGPQPSNRRLFEIPQTSSGHMLLDDLIKLDQQLSQGLWGILKKAMKRYRGAEAHLDDEGNLRVQHPYCAWFLTVSNVSEENRMLWSGDLFKAYGNEEKECVCALTEEIYTKRLQAFSEVKNASKQIARFLIERNEQVKKIQDLKKVHFSLKMRKLQLGEDRQLQCLNGRGVDVLNGNEAHGMVIQVSEGTDLVPPRYIVIPTKASLELVKNLDTQSGMANSFFTATRGELESSSSFFALNVGYEPAFNSTQPAPKSW